MQRPCSGDRRIGLAQRARRRVTRIGEERLPRFLLAFIQRGEIGMGHINFAAHLKNLRRRAFEHMWNFSDGAHIGCDVLAFVSVPARCRLDKLAAFIAQRTRQAVDFRFGRDRERRFGA